MNSVPHIESGKDIARDLCKVMLPQSRSLVGKDLVNLFHIIDKYGLIGDPDARNLLINVAPNLMTVESAKLVENVSGVVDSKDSRMAKVRERLVKEDLANKIKILKKYETIFQH